MCYLGAMRRHAQRLYALLSLLLAPALLPACGPSATELKKQQEEADYHYQLSYGYYFNPQGSQVDLALREVIESLEIYEPNADAHLLAGIIFMGRERYLEAVTHYQRAIELRPKFHFALNNLGTTYLAMERWDEAIAIFAPLVEDYTYVTKGHGLNNLGWAWFKKGELGKAKVAFRQCISQTPEMCLAYNNLALVLMEEKDNQGAEEQLSRGLKRCPEYAELYFNLGRLASVRQDLEGAAKYMAECERLAPETPLGDRCRRWLQETLPERAAP